MQSLGMYWRYVIGRDKRTASEGPASHVPSPTNAAQLRSLGSPVARLPPRLQPRRPLHERLLLLYARVLQLPYLNVADMKPTRNRPQCPSSAFSSTESGIRLIE